MILHRHTLRQQLHLKSQPTRACSLACRASKHTVNSVLVSPQVEDRPSTPLFERKTLFPSDLADEDPHIAYELLQGQQAYNMVHDQVVSWTRMSPDPDMLASALAECIQGPPTAVLVHGVLGNRRNMNSFAHMMVEAFPAWQILLVDLRCHGESADRGDHLRAPHTVKSAGGDILKLLRDLRLFPRVIIGHSFGGKVVMSMAQQFGRLPRPVKVWSLDAMPGVVASVDISDPDHPKKLISTLMRMPMEQLSRAKVVELLVSQGFSHTIAKWAATNLRPSGGSRGNGSGSGGGMEWSFDLSGISDMYDSFESSCLWGLLEAPPQGVRLNFVKAANSSLKWDPEEERRISSLGHHMHVLEGAGHWVHTDNPVGLLNILACDFNQPEPIPKYHPSAQVHPNWNP